MTGPQLRAVLDARHPDTGEQLARHTARKVPGFDHTFRAPKSVSLLWALGDRATLAEVVAAHDEAVDAAIGYLQRAAGFSRRGAGGAETVPVDGFVAAAFRHRTSRADDPLLHTHVLVANLARTTDDQIWRTLDSRMLYAHAKTAGILHQAHLRHELTTRLGVAWQQVSNGYADIDDMRRRAHQCRLTTHRPRRPRRDHAGLRPRSRTRRRHRRRDHRHRDLRRRMNTRPVLGRDFPSRGISVGDLTVSAVNPRCPQAAPPLRR